jgi:hypothetical protein
MKSVIDKYILEIVMSSIRINRSTDEDFINSENEKVIKSIFKILKHSELKEYQSKIELLHCITNTYYEFINKEISNSEKLDILQFRINKFIK